MIEEFTNILQDLDDIEDVNEEKEREYLERLKRELNFSGFLLTEYKDKNISGVFDDDIWVIKDENNKFNIIFEFNTLEELKFKGLKSSDITRVKIYMAYLLMDQEFKPISVKLNFTELIKFFTLTDFLSEDYVHGLDHIIKEELREFKDEHKIVKNIEKKNKKISRNRKIKNNETVINKRVDRFSYTGYRYVNFLIEKLGVSDPIYIEYQKQLKLINEKYHISFESRELPNSLDILNFHNYIDSFFSDKNIPKDLKLLYKPIQIWWKLTNIIPMRPSECCTTLVRDCLFKKDNDYYIKIERVKSSYSNGFPIKKEFLIDTELAEIMLEYIRDTNDYGHTETFFSYRALYEIRSRVSKLGYRVKNTIEKEERDYFTRYNLADLLKSYYRVVIEDIYKDDSYTTQIKPGDTRHFAFFSLLMQGLSPIEIALLGGHSKLETQANYQNCIEYYIGTELYEFLAGKNISKIKEKKFENLNNIINSLPTECPKRLEERLPLEIGYCLCDFSKDACDSVDVFCCFCTKWWGEPIRNTYNRWKLKIEKEIKKIDSNIFFKLSALEELLSRNYSSLFLKGSNIDAYVDTKTTINQVKNDCEKVIGLKLSIISKDFKKKFKNVNPKGRLNE